MPRTASHRIGPHSSRSSRVERTQLLFRRRIFLERLEDRIAPTCDLNAFASGLQDKLSALQSQMSSVLNTASQVPFLNRQLGDITEGQVFVTNTVNTLKNAVQTATDQSTLKTAVFTALNGLGVLGTLNGNHTTPIADDVAVSQSGDGSSCVIGFEVRLHHNILPESSKTFAFNIGLPGVPLQAATSGGVNVSVGFDYDLAVSFNVGSGQLTFDTSKHLSHLPNLNLPDHEMVLTAQVSLASTFEADVTIGFLGGTIKDHGGSTSFNVAFALDGLDPFHLSGVTPSLLGSANLDVDLKGGFKSGGSPIDARFPSIDTEFKLSWMLDSAHESGLTKPKIEFDNVTMNMGSFLSTTLTPILRDIQQVTKPFQPIVSILTAPIPGISDLSHAVGGGDISLVDLAKLVSPLLPPDYQAIISVVTTMVDVVKDVNGITITDANQIPINFGNFTIGGGSDSHNPDLRTLAAAALPGSTFANLSNLVPDVTALADNVQTQLTNFASSHPGVLATAANATKSVLTKLTNPDGIKFSFPIFQDPVNSGFRLLLGQDADFVRFSAHFHLDAEARLAFPLFGLEVGFQGTLRVDASVALAYDTFGLREFFRDVTSPSPPDAAHLAADFFDGFYIDVSNDPSTSLPRTQLSLAGGVKAFVGVGFVVFSLDVSGGISTGNGGSQPITVTFQDPDMDGKVRANELDALLSHFPNCIFSISGRLEAGISIDLRIGIDVPFIGFVGYEHSFSIASVTLLNFSNSPCNPAVVPPPPVLATVDGSGQLLLFVGPRASLRQNVDNSNGDETFIVTHEGGTLNDETVGVTAFGYKQILPHVSSILGDGTGDGSDVLTVQEGVLSDATLRAGSGKNQLTYLGSGHAHLFGGPGDDRLTAGPHSQTSDLHGGGGNDILSGGGGNDQLFGDGGPNDHDTFYAGAGNQTLRGGQGSNEFNLGRGFATVYGGPRNDLISWKVGSGSAFIDGGANIASNPPFTNILELLGSDGPDTFIISASGTSLSIAAPGATLTAINIDELNVDGGKGADSIIFNDLSGTSVQSVLINVNTEFVQADGFLDTVTLNGGSGSRTVTVDERSVTGTARSTQQGQQTQTPVNGQAMRVRGLGPVFLMSNTEDALVINLAAGNDVVNILTQTLAGAVTVNGGMGVNQFNVQGISGSTTINGVGGQNSYNVGSLAPAGGGTLPIKALLTLHGSGGNDTANVDDTGDPTGRSGTLTPTTLTGLGMTGSITYSGLAFLNIFLGSGGNTFTINDINPATRTAVDGGTSTNDSMLANFALDFNGTLLLTSFERSTIQVTRDFNGFMSDTAPGSVQLVTIGRSLTATGTLVAGSIDTLLVGQDVAGRIQVLGNLGTAAIGGSVSGLITVGGNANMITVGQDVSGTIQVTLTLTSLTINGSVTATGLIQVGGDLPTMTVGLDVAGTVVVGGTLAQLTIGRNLSGSVTESGTMQNVTIGGTMTYTGIITASNGNNPAAGNIVTMTIGPDMLSPGHDMAGRIIVSGTLTQLRVAGGTPGTIVAGHVGTVRAYGGFGPLVLQIKENGIQRRVEAAIPGSPYPIFAPPPSPTPGVSPAGVLLQYFYESGSLANPQLTVRVTNTASTAPDQFDLSLVVYNDAAKFNLARLDAVGVSGIRNVAIEGDLLTAVTPAAASFFPGDNTQAGVRLNADALAGVAVRDFAPRGFIQAGSIQAVAFGSTLDRQGRLELAADARAQDAEGLLTSDTAIVQAKDQETYRIPFADLQPVAFFLDVDAHNHHLDNKSVLFTDQLPNLPRGAVTALVKVIIPPGTPDFSTIQTIDLRGDGGAIQTQQDILQSITSTGPLGDLLLRHAHGIVANVTTPSIIGTIDASSGPISGTIQTTGIWTDPITGQMSTIPADWGRTLSSQTTTTVHAVGGGIRGRLISRGNFLSQVTADGGISGLIAVQGNLGTTVGSTRLGGILSNGPVSGQIVVLGSILGDITLHGGLTGGRIAVMGDILSNMTIDGEFDESSALVVAGKIGDATAGTALRVDEVRGILAAKGDIRFQHPPNTEHAAFFRANIGTGNPDAAAIDAIFTDHGIALAFDVSGLDLNGLALILADLAALRVSSGHLTGPIP